MEFGQSKFKDGRPHVWGKIHSKDDDAATEVFEFLIDTGANLTVIRKEILERMGYSSTVSTKTSETATGIAELSVYKGVHLSIPVISAEKELHPHPYRGIVTDWGLVPGEDGPKSNDKGYSLLGMDALKALGIDRISFNYEKEFVVLWVS